MIRLLRTLLAALVAAPVLAFALLPAPSTAATAAPARRAAVCPEVTITDSAKAAQAVFVGTVTAVASTRTPGLPGVSYQQTVTVTGIYNGKVSGDSVTVQTERRPGECTLGKLDAGTSYLFFAGGTGDPWTAGGTSGTQPATPDVVAQVQALLGQPRSPTPPATESASFTPVDTSDPQTLSRAAAPGAALVLIGLLGLAVVRVARRGRA